MKESQAYYRKRKSRCPECGFRHEENHNIGIFVPLGFNGGRYDEIITVTNSHIGGSITNGNNDATLISSNKGNGNASPLKPKSDTQSSKEKEEDSQKAKESALTLLTGVESYERRQQEELEKLHRPMMQEEKVNDLKKRQLLGEKAQILNTPQFIQDIGYVRCNCITGVPSNKPREWVAVPNPRNVGDIMLDPKDVMEPIWEKVHPPCQQVLHMSTAFLDGRTLGVACMVCREWRDVCRNVPHYYDLLQLSHVVSNIDAFDGDSIEGLGVIYGGHLVTVGAREAKLWKSINGPYMKTDNHNIQDEIEKEHYMYISTPIRDTALISKLLVVDKTTLYTGSCNGSIREWKLNPSSIQISLSATMTNHSSWINDLMISYPTHDESRNHICRMHGIPHHVCQLYSTSDDRTILNWDRMSHNRALHTVEIPTTQNTTIQSLCINERHLFAGSSIGEVYVYPLDPNVCERQDRHLCWMRNTPLPFCLQTTLKCPPPLGHDENDISGIMALDIGGRGYNAWNYMFGGSENGSIYVFQLPGSQGLEFPLFQTLRRHKGPITCLRHTWSHLYSSSHDGNIHIWCMGTFFLQRALCCDCSVSTLYIQELEWDKEKTDEDWTEENSSRALYAGLLTGKVMKWRLGLWM